MVGYGRYLVWLVCALGLFGCANDSEEAALEAYIESVKSQPVKPLPPLAPRSAIRQVAYAGDTLRSPFQLPQTNQVPQKVNSSGPTPDLSRPKSLLETFPLDALRYLGSFERAGYRWGIVEDKAGHLHQVQLGEYIGLNFGQVLSISETEIRLEEMVKKPQGGWVIRHSQLPLIRSFSGSAR